MVELGSVTAALGAQRLTERSEFSLLVSLSVSRVLVSLTSSPRAGRIRFVPTERDAITPCEIMRDRARRACAAPRARARDTHTRDTIARHRSAHTVQLAMPGALPRRQAAVWSCVRKGQYTSHELMKLLPPGPPPPKGKSLRQPDWSRLIHFMMLPAVQTVQAGLEANGFATTLGGGPLELLHSAVLRELGVGDVFVWVGVGNLEWTFAANDTRMVVRDVMRNLTAKGVLTVFYSTESFLSMPCSEKRALPVREIWEYTRSNVLCCPDDPSTVRVRFVPPGYVARSTLAGATRATGSAPVRRVADRPDAPPRLLFFGSVVQWYWLRKRCMVRIAQDIVNGWATGNERSARAAAALNRQCLVTACDQCNASLCPIVIKHSMSEDSHWDATIGKHLFHLNVHKACEFGLTLSDPSAALNVSCESFRIATLLSAGADVYSERCHPTDEQEYEGLVRFLPIEKLSASVLDAWRSDPLGELAGARARERVKLFARRFAPAALFERAGLPAALAAHREGGIGTWPAVRSDNESLRQLFPSVPQFCCLTVDECRAAGQRTSMRAARQRRPRRPRVAPVPSAGIRPAR